ncbi:glycosyltransferase [Candidatus Gottesmanbacteria bacterium]|nr:glycosyltransferase [Candidatus Gottesmanbacteria bacterium]
MLLSVIIPAWRQEKTIARDLKRIEKVLRKIRYDYEMVVVVDGKVDKTYQQAKKIASSKIKVYQYFQNQGKGYAVQYGFSKARGDYLAFIDAGAEIDPNGLSMLLEHLEWYRADIIVGSKRHLASVVTYPLDRKILSLGYYFLVWLLFQIKIKDTQAGIKIFRRPVLEKVLPVLLVQSDFRGYSKNYLEYSFGYLRRLLPPKHFALLRKTAPSSPRVIPDLIRNLDKFNLNNFTFTYL